MSAPWSGSNSNGPVSMSESDGSESADKLKAAPLPLAAPLPPLTQLIAVLPPLSAHLLPQSYASLVLADDSSDSASPVRGLRTGGDDEEALDLLQW